MTQNEFSLLHADEELTENDWEFITTWLRHGMRSRQMTVKFEGYQPRGEGLDISDPSQGGSGVPPKPPIVIIVKIGKNESSL